MSVFCSLGGLSNLTTFCFSFLAVYLIHPNTLTIQEDIQFVL